ncbi:iron complex transport system permease protein [Alicyclobacillus macrosporangiidus]|uniref:Iron complex transport system permease protein n=1 Tax=Alicyclobacillus macrosporangiidus TaxID=392015 RepID=A0A1I7JHF5_9BACL|nr:iron complex transport system permease protein [Alicyclobacillus macrosporangiidus]
MNSVRTVNEGVLTNRLWGKVWILLLLFIGVLFSALFSVCEGLGNSSISAILAAALHPSGSQLGTVLQEVRIPRALIGVIVGACLGLSGVLLQTMTRNRLADVGIFGLNAGASFAVVLGISLFGMTSVSALTWMGLLGSLAAGACVYLMAVSAPGRASPTTITLAGAALTMLLSSLTHALLVLDQPMLSQVLFWISGSLAGRSMHALLVTLPFLAAGALIAVGMVRALALMEFEDDVAEGLGQRVLWMRLAAGLAVILLAGGCVALAGPVGFLGLMTPHLGRWLVGSSMPWLLSYSACLGALVLVWADVAARTVLQPSELPIGVLTALIGAPFLIHVARRGGIRS